MKNGHVRDYAYKSEILKNKDLIRAQKLVKKALYRNEPVIDYKTGDVLSVEEALDFWQKHKNDSDFIEVQKINQSTYHRATKIRNRLKYFLSLGNCIFLTLTFNEETLSATSSETRRQYVRKYLKSVSDWYVANIDFGGKNGREHYHAVVLANNVDYSLWHKNGAIKGEKVRSNGVSEAKLGKYLSKLTNHAIKETTKRQAVLFGCPNRAH